jgi:hypothetical protein
MTHQSSADISALAAQVRETIAVLNECTAQMQETREALSECIKSRNAAEAMLVHLKFKKHANNVWANAEL